MGKLEDLKPQATVRGILPGVVAHCQFEINMVVMVCFRW
jgi:hypothetical protein